MFVERATTSMHLRKGKGESVAEKNSAILTTLALSLIGGCLAAVLFVLPAEYNIDPTGVGETIGIKGMAGVSVSAISLSEQEYGFDEIEFPLMPFESIEYKYELAQGQAMVYSWTTEAEVLFDMHSEEEGTDPEDSVSFSVGRSAAEHGTYVAPYSGIHGWFWENRGDSDVVVRLKTAGFYDASITYSSAGEFRREMNGP